MGKVLGFLAFLLFTFVSYFLFKHAYANYKLEDWFLMGFQSLGAVISAAFAFQMLFFSVLSAFFFNEARKSLEKRMNEVSTRYKGL